MFTSYSNSFQWQNRTRNYQDYCSLLPERSESYKLSQPLRCYCVNSRSSCCCCCSTSSSSSFVKPKVTINPGFVLYGLRQSTLIQWPSFQRRLLVGGGRLMGYDVYSSCDGTRRKNRSFRVRAIEESDECCGGSSCSNDVEAMISFLSEELVDEDREWKLVGGVEEKKKKVRYGGEFHGGNVRKVRVEARDKNRVSPKNERKRLERPEGFGRRNGIAEDVKLQERDDCEHCGRRKKSSQLESGGYIGKTYGEKKEEKEVRPRRTKSSSCSSYYSLASSGEFESDDSDDQEENVEFHRERLRSSEKKNVVEQSLQSRKEASQTHSRRKRDNKSSNGVGSSYRKQVFEEGENSNQAVTLNQRKGKKFSQTNNRVSESSGNHEEDMEIHEVHVNEAETSSQNQKLFGEIEDYRVHSIRNDSGSENIESSQQQLKESLKARYSSEERASEMRRRTKYSSIKEEDINVLQNFQEAKNNRQPPVEERISKQAGMRMSTERFSENTDIDIRNTYISQREEQIRNQEVHAGLVTGLQSERKQQEYHIEQNPLQKAQSERTSVSVSHISDAVRYTEIKRKSEKRLIDQGSTTIVQSEKAENSGAWKDSRLDHANSTKEGQKAVRLQSSQEKLSEEASSSQSSLNFVSRNKMQLVDLVSEEMQGSETTLIPPSSQMVSRGSGQTYESGGVSVQEIFQGTSESGYPTAIEHLVAGASVNSRSAGGPMRFTTQEDALGSAHRLEESSEKFVGEFMKKAKHEVSNPETEERRGESNQLMRRDSRRSSGGSGAKGPSDEMWVTNSAQGTPHPGTTEGDAAVGNAIVKRTGRSLWTVIADIARLRWGSRAGSPDSSAKPAGKSSSNESVSSATWFSGREHDGSSDDNTKGDRVLPQESPSLHQLEVGQASPRSQFESSGATELKQRSGRHEGIVSLPSSTILEGRSGSSRLASTSSDQIVGVDEEEEGGNFKFRLPETASTQVPMKLPSRNLIRSPAIKEPSEDSPTEVSSGQIVTMGEGRRYQARVPEMGAGQKPLPFPGRNLRSPIVKEPTEDSPTEVSSGQNVTVGEGKHYQARVPEMGAGQKPLPFPGRNLRSPVIKQPSESRPGIVSGSSSLSEQVEQQQPLSAKSQEETGSISKESVLTQRKFQRNKQVVRDSFEEWEEAYKVEAERRTVDEIFMREALVEAKKAADTWEVPVGAVLVHDGKIIARGFNLVEELRDSTAHAEMICIREGSKVLRSWRLADTTLYVTLEPCPMCAGAILQARVKTLVWGAPNKLLGADGSWIRLFPGGEGSGSEVSDKPPPPVHPFHPKMIVRRGVLESDCAETMQQFFQLRRKKKDKNLDPPTPTDHHHHHLPSKLLNKMHQALPFFCL